MTCFHFLFRRWFSNKSNYPRLHKLACHLFAIPASSASVERVFSKAGYTSNNRPNLNPSTLDNLMLLKSNHDLYESKIKEVVSADDSE